MTALAGAGLVRESAALWFISAHRSRRCGRPVGYVPDPGLSVWCAWEEVERSLGLGIARDVARGRVPSEYELDVFRLAGERLVASRARYVALATARRAKRAVS